MLSNREVSRTVGVLGKRVQGGLVLQGVQEFTRQNTLVNQAHSQTWTGVQDVLDDPGALLKTYQETFVVWVSFDFVLFIYNLSEEEEKIL